MIILAVMPLGVIAFDHYLGHLRGSPLAKRVLSLIRNPQSLNHHQLVAMPKRKDEQILRRRHNYS